MSNPLTNPLLDRLNKMPGETIRLPSLGRFYLNGEVTEDVVDGEVVLNPMTMTDEILMKSPDMLFQGTAIERVFTRCAPQIQKPMDLLTSDVDFILTHLRRISFGSTIDIPFTCKNETCKHEQEVQVPLDYFTNESKEIDIDNFEAKFQVKTKSDGRIVHLKPVTFREFLKLQQLTNETLNDPDNLRFYVLDSYASVILAVDDLKNDCEQNREFIREWLDSLPRKDTALISKAIANVQDWGPTFKYTAVCNKCDHRNELTTELNPTAFFIRPSNLETQD